MNMHESSLRGNSAYPIVLYQMPNGRNALHVLFHWQDDVEILSITRGEVELSVDSERYQLCTGDMVCINPGQLHSFRANTPDAACNIFIFPFEHLMFAYEDHDQIDFLRPLMNGQYGFPLRLEWAEQQIMLRVIELQKECPVAYEMQTKALLLQMIAQLAEKNGFVHCHPTKQNDVCKSIVNYIREHYSESLTVSGIAVAVGISPTYFSAYFTEHFAQSFSSYLCSYRINKACTLLSGTTLSVTEIALTVGFGSGSHFIRNFHRVMGMTPLTYRLRSR